MKIGSIVTFDDELFFDGAVQLSWFERRKEQAQRAAQSFVFHGPRYHGANDAATDGVDSSYQLKDTASFTRELIGSLLSGERGQDTNPYWLVVAGYGSGKSHLALTCSTLLSAPQSEAASSIAQHIIQADAEIGNKISEDLALLKKPALVLPLDGMSGFHLGNALSKAVFSQFKLLDIDPTPIRNLSPRFKTAAQFVERNYLVRQEEFNDVLSGLTQDEIIQKLNENDESVYEGVDRVYEEANGHSIPVEGQESAQDLIDTLCNYYCSDDGPFSHVIIMFDEFGRYLEYAADKPHLAGDAALQQIFQGIQDNSEKVRFIGFIQYELKTYLKRFSGNGLRQLQRYITRFDAAEKWYLSSNLETIFAHMIKKDETLIDELWLKTNAEVVYQQAHIRLSSCLPGFSRYPVWQDGRRFNEVIGRGCWPLHPLAVWFLTRQKDVVQSRSALTFIKAIVSRVSDDEAAHEGRIQQVSVAELLLQNMLSELVAAERDAGGTVAETLQTLLEKFGGHLDQTLQLILAGTAALEKMRIGRQARENAEALICEATSLDSLVVKDGLKSLSELGALEWNSDLGQFELLTDGASRAQFQQWLRKLQQDVKIGDIYNLFMRYGAKEQPLADIVTDFGALNQISTPDWRFESLLAHPGNISTCIKQAFKNWSEAYLPTDAKGKVIYFYIGNEDNSNDLQSQMHAMFAEELQKWGVTKAPIWVIGIRDNQSLIGTNLTKLHLFEEQVSASDQERFRRFIPEEVERSKEALETALKTALKERLYWVPGITTLTEQRQKRVGSEIFSTIYTHPIPFPFDGFATKNGTAKADCAQLMRGLVARQVDGSWVQSQRKSLHNRVDSLLAKTWGSLLPSGALVAPREPNTKSIFDTLVEEHKSKTDLTLESSYKWLISPPYGMSAASAGILISLLISLDVPPRRLEYNGELQSSEDWLKLAFQGRSNDLQVDVLAKTTLHFLSENGETRWRALLQKWESAQAYDEKLKVADEAKSLYKADPIPETLEGLYRYHLDESEKVKELLLAKTDFLKNVERSLANAERTGSVEGALKAAKKVLFTRDELVGNGLWPESLITEADNLLNFVHELISSNLREWILRQVCQSVVNLADFRAKTESYINTIKKLGYEKESKALHAQMTSSINRVEKLQSYQLTLAECEDYPRQPAPTGTTPVKELRDQVARGEELIKAITSAKNVLTSEEISAYVTAIKARQDTLKKADKERREELGLLYETPKSEQALAELLSRARVLHQCFLGTRDETDISEVIYQLEHIINDITLWPSSEMSADRLEALLLAQIQQQEAIFSKTLEEQDLEPAWPDNIYEILAHERINNLVKQSNNWVLSRTTNISEINQLSKLQCVELKRELEAAPGFLTEHDRKTVADLLSELDGRLDAIERDENFQNNHNWLSQFPSSERIANLNQAETNKWLQRAEAVPSSMDESGWEKIDKIQKELKSRLDNLSAEDIIQRIIQLPERQQREVLELLLKELNPIS
ncbi:hypothetical protein [Alteromonas sp. CyTr2]|uniref:hypothetical protein n=1 Tax=Alteromonas sp. CyTr2 TaxID=2935039 RepID=UPI00248E5955|nr:hypothetical protein [Alteromonas sp. CyTr2]